MAISIRFLSGSLEGQVFEFDRDVIRVGDAPDVDLKVDPLERDNAGARDRVIEVFRDSNGFRLHSTGNRELSAQGDTTIDRMVKAGEEVRFGAWGPIFQVAEPAVPHHPSTVSGATAPIRVGDDSTASRRKKDKDVRMEFKTPSGETPVGPKTVYLMIQEALGKARETDGGVVERGTIFVREMVGETIRHATRQLKIGLALMAAALVVLAVVLVSNIASTKRSLTEASAVSDRKVTLVKEELSTQLGSMKSERDRLAKESEALKGRLDEVAKTAEGGQQAVAEMRRRLAEAEERRKDLEARMQKAVAAVEADRAALAAEKQRIERAEAEARRKAEEERQAREAAERAKAAEAAASEPMPVQTTSASPSTSPK